MCTKYESLLCVLCGLSLLPSTAGKSGGSEPVAPLPRDIQVVWDLDKAHRESTETRERICINGLWRWQPSPAGNSAVPESNWGHFKVPGCWPGITNYMQKDCQTVFEHPSWKDERLGGITAAWYQREITVPETWVGRRIVLSAEYVNSLASVYVDEVKVGEILFPAGEIELSDVCQPGQQHRLSILVEAMPLKAVMLSYSDTASARQVKGQVARRGLCGDLYLSCTPTAARVDDAKVETSVRNGQITFDAALANLDDDAHYVLQAQVIGADNTRRQFQSRTFGRAQLNNGRFRFTEAWLPKELWDVHTPENMCQLQLSLLSGDSVVVDTAYNVRFGFREFWIDGRDFYLNGTRIFLSSVPLDNAQVGAAWATYDAARESMARLASFGINFVYTHNYGCEPGTHLSFEQILRAADDIGMLVGFSQPHFGQYDWGDPDAGRTNGYAQHAKFYVRAAQNHPSVVAYSTSHNATGYADDMNPQMIDGIQDRRSQWSQRNADRALRAEAIIRGLDPSRIVYHHAGGNLGAMHTSNFYANFVPIQEMSEWFEHWSTHGVKPLFTCEYSVPFPWDWSMYRGWYDGKREFGSAAVPWELCMSQWNAQFVGDRAYRISEKEKRNLRWESQQYKLGNVWHRWDYPHPIGSTDFSERYPIYGMYFADNWPAFRTWGVSAIAPWNHGHYWVLREGVDRGRKNLDVDWQNLQRPGLSPDYIDDRYERMDLAYQPDDWMPTVAAEVLIRNNAPVLAYIAGEPESFTCKDHNFYPGETVKKQVIVINNSRQRVTAHCNWQFSLGATDSRGSKLIDVEPGQQVRVLCERELPADLEPSRYEIKSNVKVSGRETLRDSFTIDVLPRPSPHHVPPKIALFDPRGETATQLAAMHVPYTKVEAADDLDGIDLLVVGRRALTLDGPAPDIARVRRGLKVLVFEQSAEVLEKRLGFRIAEYGLRRVFPRVADHPALAGLGERQLRDWRGEATLTPPHTDRELDPRFNYAPTDEWCDIPVSRIWRCGNRGSVASVLIEKPARGDFLPILDGGFGLQYSPLMEYREGSGMVLFCQMDVTGRTVPDPASERLLLNLLEHVAKWRPAPRRRAVYAGGTKTRRHLDAMGISAKRFEGQKLSDNDVLIVGSDDPVLSNHAAGLSQWIAAGGHVLALGLGEREAKSFMLDPVEMEENEHIATWFKPFSSESLLAGVSPADVYNAAPRKLFLLSGHSAIGNGVLGRREGTHLVFSQLAPSMIDAALDVTSKTPGTRAKPGAVSKQLNLKRTYRRVSFLTARLLANMGIAASTPTLERFSSPVRMVTGPAADSTRGRWLDGLYIDTPEEWDDPYRFFRW